MFPFYFHLYEGHDFTYLKSYLCRFLIPRNLQSLSHLPSFLAPHLFRCTSDCILWVPTVPSTNFEDKLPCVLPCQPLPPDCQLSRARARSSSCWICRAWQMLLNQFMNILNLDHASLLMKEPGIHRPGVHVA